MRPKLYAKRISGVTKRVRSTIAALNMHTFSGVRDIKSKLLSGPKSCAAVLPVMMVSSIPFHDLESISPSKIAQALKEWSAASSSTAPIPGVAACAATASLHLALARAFANACAHKRLWRADTIVSAVPTAPRNDTCLEVVGEPAGEVAAGSNSPESSFGTSVPSRTCLNANEQGIKHPHAESFLQWCPVTDANENMHYNPVQQEMRWLGEHFSQRLHISLLLCCL